MNFAEHVYCRSPRLIIPFILTSCLMGSLQGASSAELKLVEKRAPRQTILSVLVDDVKLLAGMKIVIGFDGMRYSVVEMRKSAATENFIDLINDKEANKAIVVMASAKGTTGKDLELFSLDMKHLEENTGSSNNFKVLHCEMMDEKLKEIPCQ